MGKTPTELKKELVNAGLEIFRVKGTRVHLADRVRENLIMDSGVAAVAGNDLAVRMVVRAQKSQFPEASESELFAHARAQAKGSGERGYTEVDTAVVPVDDPSGGVAPLDVWYEVAFEKPVSPAELVEELQFALGVEKASSTG